MKRTQIFARGVALLGASVLVAGCDESTAPDEFTDAMVIDAAVLAADATVEEVNMWSESFGFGLAPVSSQYDVTSGETAAFGSPGGRGSWSGDFSGTREVTFFDAEGVEQGEYDPLLTASIYIVREIQGTIVRDRFTAEIERERAMTVSGLLGEESTRTWNGEGSSSVSRAGVLEDGTERSHTAEGTYEFDDVVVPIPGSDSRWPLSGTVTRMMTMTRVLGDETQTREVEIIITFNGTAMVTALVNGEEVEIDLSARDGRNPLRRLPRGG